MQNSKWGVVNSTEPIYVVLFVSRNKDNKDIRGFRERRTSFLVTLDDKTLGSLNRKFNDFVSHGVPGEFCRFYISQNARHAPTIHKELLKFLIDDPDFNLCSLPAKLAGIAATHKCAAERGWFFDFDSTDETLLNEFLEDLRACIEAELIECNRTPHGYAVKVSHGFDTRYIMSKWGDTVTLKKDDLLCVDWQTTPAKRG